uniref:Subtilisin n=1 Tax=Chromera velia CCMP2878 TaxID=1169474 RepID=A0A0G4I6R7_9ALVE|eukprot:Cvel_11471.t1-p1 / transcript=Cvel_11471.t1 / gene=Cvel_11471 / organism=Chromera_velia_CCMP2878 / gene_product=hypothetical protein / transcript_product=hypothetical protein / location=Cvel_scaffold722:34352-36403(+) / protein_length=684 / sequence_SO=supercontig / SO=protein_coding / is_pseudo=false
MGMPVTALALFLAVYLCSAFGADQSFISSVHQADADLLSRAADETIQSTERKGYPTGAAVPIVDALERRLWSWQEQAALKKSTETLVFLEVFKEWSGLREWTELMAMQYPDFTVPEIFKEADSRAEALRAIKAGHQDDALRESLRLQRLVEKAREAQEEEGGLEVKVAVIDYFDPNITSRQVPGVVVRFPAGSAPESTHGNEILDTILTLLPNVSVSLSLWSAPSDGVAAVYERVNAEEDPDVICQAQGWFFPGTEKGEQTGEKEEKEKRLGTALSSLMETSVFMKALGNEGVDYLETPPFFNRTRESASIGTNDAENIPHFLIRWFSPYTAEGKKLMPVFAVNTDASLEELNAHASAPGKRKDLQEMSVGFGGIRFFGDEMEGPSGAGVWTGSSYVTGMLTGVYSSLVVVAHRLLRFSLKNLSEEETFSFGRCLLEGPEVTVAENAEVPVRSEVGELNGVPGGDAVTASGVEGGKPDRYSQRVLARRVAREALLAGPAERGKGGHGGVSPDVSLGRLAVGRSEEVSGNLQSPGVRTASECEEGGRGGALRWGSRKVLWGGRGFLWRLLLNSIARRGGRGMDVGLGSGVDTKDTVEEGGTEPEGEGDSSKVSRWSRDLREAVGWVLMRRGTPSLVPSDVAKKRKRVLQPLDQLWQPETMGRGIVNADCSLEWLQDRFSLCQNLL